MRPSTSSVVRLPTQFPVLSISKRPLMDDASVAAGWFESIPPSWLEKRFTHPTPKRPPPVPVVVRPFASVQSSEAAVAMLRTKHLLENRL